LTLSWLILSIWMLPSIKQNWILIESEWRIQNCDWQAASQSCWSWNAWDLAADVGEITTDADEIWGTCTPSAELASGNRFEAWRAQLFDILKLLHTLKCLPLNTIHLC
jgi:hypothetical protein